ncbi:hypothetical protein [Micromonospora sp. NPDC051296]|uniref:hypothetical protein n=1 Tax=Micromonospora sp. NPDC051296 TaxID=3155046 RepID=UPI00344ABCBC
MESWWTVVGTLGGIALTATVGLVTALPTHRWQQERLRLEQRFVADRELRATRRETYARYLVSAQRLFDAANTLFRQHRTQPLDTAELAANPPEELRSAIASNEASRVEVMLLADGALRETLAVYDRALWDLWPAMASGADRQGQKA